MRGEENKKRVALVRWAIRRIRVSGMREGQIREIPETPDDVRAGFPRRDPSHSSPSHHPAHFTEERDISCGRADKTLKGCDVIETDGRVFADESLLCFAPHPYYLA